MPEFIEVAPKDFTVSPFELVGKQNMLVAAEMNGRINAMTAAWGGLGVMWRKDAAFIVLRPQRYTREFVDAAPAFSLNFFGPEYRDTLTYFGTVSGRDEDKVAKRGLTVEHGDGAPYFAEAESVLLCRKLYAQPYEEKCFVDKSIDAECYPGKDYHIFYIGEVVRILRKK